jgi:glycosyltransferase involved in cell wall biosynthesis
MRVLALMKYGPRAASTRQRLMQFEPFLHQHGVSVELSPLLGDEHIARLAEGRSVAVGQVLPGYARRLATLLRSRSYDVIWVHSELFPYLPGFLESLVGITGRPVVYDCDDAVFHMYDAHPNPAIRWLLGSKLQPLLRTATVALCGNAYLESYAARYCRRTLIVPTVVDTEAYVPVPRHGDAAPVVGWIGSPSTWRYVEPLLPAILAPIAAAGGRFRAVGAGPRARGIAGVEALDWSEDTEIAEVQSFDIGIMPIPDDKWARGKCGYKLIQYMACGLPVIASPVGVNTEIVEEGRNGYFATSAAEWQEALKGLLADANLRSELGRNGRARVVER